MLACSGMRVSDNVDLTSSSITGNNTIPMYSTILTQSAVLPDRNVFTQEHPWCMQYLCLSTSSMMFRAGDVFYGCQGQYPALSELTFMSNRTTNNSNKALSVTAIPAYGYYGQIQCPNASVVCGGGSTLSGLDVAAFPKLLSIEPMSASVAGGARLTVRLSVGSSISASVTCKGLLIGGQPTNASTWEQGTSVLQLSTVTRTFAVNTLPLSSVEYGGANSDGSGVVDVSLLCRVPGALECGTQYDGYCAVATWRQAFELFTPLEVSGSSFESVIDEYVRDTTSSLAAAPALSIISHEESNGDVTRRGYFSMPKVAALKTSSVVVNVQLRLVPRIRMRYALTGKRVALGPEGLAVTVLNQTDLLLSMKVSGSQYLATVANVNIPLTNVLTEGVRVTGSSDLPIQFVFTATTMTAAITSSRSIATYTGPISAIFGTTPASAVAVLRLSVILDILQCGFGGDDGGTNLIGMRVGPSNGASLRGAVVGNLLIIVAVLAFIGILMMVFLAYGRITHNAPSAAMLEDLLDIFHFPGIGVLPVTALCQPTLTAVVQLIAVEPVDGDYAFGVLGGLALLLLLMVPYTVVITTQFCLTLVNGAGKEEDKQHTDAAPPVSMMRRIINVLFLERASWQPVDPARRDHVAWKKRFAPVFIDCSVWWYPLADLWSGAAVGVVGGLTLGNKSVCFFQLGVVSCTYAFIALLQLVFAPPLVLASRCYVVLLQVLGLISCGAVLAAGLTNDNDENTLSVVVASYSMLTIAIVSTAKSLVDVVFMLLAIPRRIRRAAAVGALHAPAPLLELRTIDDYHNTKYSMNVEEEPEWSIMRSFRPPPPPPPPPPRRHSTNENNSKATIVAPHHHAAALAALILDDDDDDPFSTATVVLPNAKVDNEMLKEGLSRVASKSKFRLGGENKHRSFHRTPSFAPPQVMSASGGRRKMLNFGTAGVAASDATITAHSTINVAPQVPPQSRRIDFVDVDDDML
ncbi:transmembrane protein, putative [Bodo saltans]|uniref:Transmembrane protein, putative n=1 Tax=Bodo saltans TaxID=75058 RepID=A0A0S4IQ82_BODSA|nr:transmembrane protein, putative [Bodo saltans]|eukprot:CUF93709.1 transmembrane protein, putative [Bodo saltans]